MARPSHVFFKPKGTPKFKPLKRFGVIDIETVGIGGEFIIGGVMYSDERTLLTFDNRETLFEHCMHNPCTYYAHNGGNFDFLYFLEFILDIPDNYQTEFIQHGSSRVLIIDIRNTEDKKFHLTFQDSYPIFNSSLKDAGKAYAKEARKGEIDFEKGEVFDPSNPVHMEYLKNDHLTLIEALEGLHAKFFEQFGVGLGATCGSMAINALRQNLDEGKAYFHTNKKNQEFIRKAIHGGLVLPGERLGENPGIYIDCDFKGAYGWQMTKEYPACTPCTTWEEEPGLLGLYRIKITHVPEDVFCWLIEEEHCCYVKGAGYYTYAISEDLDYCKELGITYEVQRGLTWDHTEKVFYNFIKKCEELETAEDATYKPVAKLCRNSAFGKTIEKPTRKKFKRLSHEEWLNQPASFLMQGQDGHIVEDWISYSETVEKDYMIPEWGVFITARQRLELARLINWYYKRTGLLPACDTDSIKVNERYFEEFHEACIKPTLVRIYGRLEIKGRLHKLHVGASKNHCAWLEREGFYEAYQKSKGANLKNLPIKEHERACNGEEVYTTRTRMISAFVRMKDPKLPISTKLTRKVSHLIHSNGWTTYEDGRIRPRTIEELNARRKKC